MQVGNVVYLHLTTKDSFLVIQTQDFMETPPETIIFMASELLMSSMEIWAMGAMYNSPEKA